MTEARWSERLERAEREREEWQDRFVRLCTELGALIGDIKRLTRERDTAIRERDLTANDLRILRDDHAKLKLTLHNRAKRPAESAVEEHCQECGLPFGPGIVHEHG